MAKNIVLVCLDVLRDCCHAQLDYIEHRMPSKLGLTAPELLPRAFAAITAHATNPTEQTAEVCALLYDEVGSAANDPDGVQAMTLRMGASEELAGALWEHTDGQNHLYEQLNHTPKGEEDIAITPHWWEVLDALHSLLTGHADSAMRRIHEAVGPDAYAAVAKHS